MQIIDITSKLFEKKYTKMNKFDLLIEMSNFELELIVKGKTKEVINRGIVLFKILEKKADTEEFRRICEFNRTYLEQYV